MNGIQNDVNDVRNELGKQLMAGVNGMTSNQVADAILNPTNKFRRLARMVRTAEKLSQQIDAFKHSID